MPSTCSLHDMATSSFHVLALGLPGSGHTPDAIHTGSCFSKASCQNLATKLKYQPELFNELFCFEASKRIQTLSLAEDVLLDRPSPCITLL